jgi:hypothetical protein
MPRGLFGDPEVAKPGLFRPFGERRGAAWITHSKDPGEGESPLLSPDLAPKGVAR